WLTVMAPAQVVDVKDLPPEVLQALPRALAADSGAAQQARPANAAAAAAVVTAAVGWEEALRSEAQRLLAEGRRDVWDVLSQRFERCLIDAALQSTHGRRIEAAQRLGIGRNTITRKLHELQNSPLTRPPRAHAG
ncbi:MAG: hypothetical protein N2690_09785, partial [Rhodocyclaceae bacterium]|nr:hypothetical protein [Rhodocyclaceae bacterium]